MDDQALAIVALAVTVIGHIIGATTITVRQNARQDAAIEEFRRQNTELWKQLNELKRTVGDVQQKYVHKDDLNGTKQELLSGIKGLKEDMQRGQDTFRRDLDQIRSAIEKLSASFSALKG